jgi:hypothetical protein
VEISGSNKETFAIFDPGRTGLLWKVWRRNFRLYLDLKDIGSERHLRSMDLLISTKGRLLKQ